jgi:hypothetical protein
MPSDAERIKSLEAELATYKPNGSVALYYELNRFINSTVTLMRKQNLEDLMSKDDGDPKRFERMMVLIKNAKEHAVAMTEIKSMLKLSGDESKDKDIPFVETVAETRR